MQNQKKKTIKEVKKPILMGSWHGKDAFRQGRKLMLSILAVTVVYLLLGMVLLMDSMVMRALICVGMVFLAAAYLYSQGMTKGEGDAAHGEIMYQRVKDGLEIAGVDRDRSYHPAKGFFAVMVGALPFVLLAVVFAFLTKPAAYTLGVLPSWLEPFRNQNELGDALRYYSAGTGMVAMDIYRIVVRAMVMPFINVATGIGDQAVLWAERLSPALLLIAPMGYGLGYRNGLKARVRINTGIAVGEAKKKKRARREQKKRAEHKPPERLV